MMDGTLGEGQWDTFVHKYRRWRLVMYPSPHRHCLETSLHSKKTLEDVDSLSHITSSRPNSVPITSLWRSNVIIACVIYYSLWCVPISVLESVAEAMQKPFPELTYPEKMHR